MKNTYLLVSSVVFLAISAPVQAIEIGASIGVGGKSVDVGASVGHGSVASASVGVGSSSGSSSVNVDLGHSTGGTGINKTGPGVGGSDLDPQLLPFADYIGRDVLSRDRVKLGEVTEVKAAVGGSPCPILGLSPDKSLPISADRVWLRMETCSDGKGAIKIGMTSGNFVKSVTN